MPIALLPELAASLVKVGARLSPWERLAGLEEQILRRARGAFLVSWFGPRVPELRLSLHIAIVNIAALREQYQLAARSMEQPFPRLNLLGPIAGMTGFAVGLFMSPSGSILFMPFLHDAFDMLTDSWWREPLKMFYALIGNWIMPLVGPAFGLAVLAPAGILGAVVLAISGERTSHAAVRLLGDVAMMADAFLRFWDQLTGPVEDIRNPLVKAVMQLLGRISALFAQVLGFVAVVIVRLAPLIPNLIEQYRATLALGEEVFATLRDMVATLWDDLMAPFRAGRGLVDTLFGVFDSLLALPGQLIGIAEALISDTGAVLRDAFTAISALVEGYVSGVAERIVQAFHMTPLGWLVEQITRLAAILPQFVAAVLAVRAPEVPPPPPPPERNWLGRAWDWTKETASDAGSWVGRQAANAYTGGLTGQVAELQDAIGRLRFPGLPDLGALPALPGLPTLPDTATLVGPMPETPDFAGDARRFWADAEAQAGATPRELLRRPPSAFRGARAELEAQGHPVLDDAERGLRDMIYLAVGRVLPAALRIHAPEVRAMFDRVDEYLYPDAPAAPAPDPDHPQQVLPDSGRLAPHVGTLRVRAPDSFEAPDLRVFRDRLVEVMGLQPYYAADAG